MVDNRAAGYFGIGGAFNFKSGDISGTAARTQDDKMGQGGEYFAQQQQEEFEQAEGNNQYMDRSAVLRATLNSLAMMNVANVINARKIEAKKQEDLIAMQKQLLKKKHEESLHGSINSSEDVNLKSSSEDEVEDIVD
jgi:hypothetical protein